MVNCCTELDLPFDPATQIAAFETAKMANMRNIPESNIIHPVHLALVRNKIHKVGTTLRVKFLNGNTKQKSKVKEHTAELQKYANIKFEFVESGNSDLRIGFKWQGNTGSWSYIGTDNLQLSQDRQTMNFGWLDDNASDREFRRVILHELLHALGAIHEHQNPSVKINWDKEATYEYYRKTQGWDRRTVDINIFRKYDANLTQFSQFDKNSIMLYPIPNELTLDNFEVGMNSELSDMDKQYIQTIYPFEYKPQFPVINVGDVLKNGIGKWMEEDYFEFALHADTPQTILAETGGETDTVMSLFNSNKEVIAWDDDTGQERNAQIVKVLNKGNYIIRVRHYSIFGTGDYTLALKSVI